MQNLFHKAGHRTPSGIKANLVYFLKVFSYLGCYPKPGNRKIVKMLLAVCRAERSFLKFDVLMK